jgi:hypothetical protein
MRFPQVVIYETDGRLAHVLAGLIAEKRWILRESRQPDSCLRILRANVPSVLVLAITVDSDSQLELLDQAVRSCLEVRIIAVCAGNVLPSLPGIAWDLGADFVLSPPMPLTHLPEIVSYLMPGNAI